MTSVPEATSIILAHLFVASTEPIVVGRSSGRILGERIVADRDLPPFDRVTMDGIALSSAAFQRGCRSFRIVATLAAGSPTARLPEGDVCFEIMTGAPLPEGCDTIVRIEDVRLANRVAHINITAIEPGTFVHRRGSDAMKDSVLLDRGIRISAADTALLATVGKETVKVVAFPRVAIVTTGDELVAIGDTPLPHQIRRSNATALEAALLELQCPSHVFHIPDDKSLLERELRAILDSHDVIILSGGVSKGKFDFVPDVLEGLSVKMVFHQVSQRPGKPLWFGVSDKQTVFALPGNPVSTFLCFHRYVKPWLMKSLGFSPVAEEAILAEDYTFRPALTYFLQVRIRFEKGCRMAYPVTGGGSGDFTNLASADGFLELPLEGSSFKAGEVFSFIPFR